MIAGHVVEKVPDSVNQERRIAPAAKLSIEDLEKLLNRVTETHL
jgi:hypothetical protein